MATPPPPDPVKAASWYVDHGFGVFPVWYPKTSLVCSCPDGARCPTPGKHPATKDGFKAASLSDSFKTWLKNPGTRNYGMVCPHDVIAVDVDGVDGLALWEDLQREYGPLPASLTTLTANGRHHFYRTPGGHPSGKMFGFVVRDHDSGYVIGPGSKHPSGKYYDTLRQPGGAPFELADLPEAWLVGWMATRTPMPTSSSSGSSSLITTTETYRVPEVVAEGARYPEMVRYTLSLWNRGFSMNEMWGAVVAELAPRFSVSKDDAVLRSDFDRATKELGSKYPRSASGKVTEPAVVAKAVDPDAISALIERSEDYLASIPDHFDWIGNMAALGYVTLVAAPPKAGKSTLISGLLRARGLGTPFLGHAVPVGPTLLIAEEAGPVIKRKIEGIEGLEIMTRVAFKRAGLGFAEMLGVIRGWATPGGLVVIDTLAKWAEVKDENDAAVMGAALDAIIQVAQDLHIAIIIIHHTKKGGGEHGEALRGSSAILGSVDHVIEVEFVKDSDQRVLVMYGRLDFPTRFTVSFDRDTLAYEVVADTEAGDDDRLDDFPQDAVDAEGWRESDMAAHWGGIKPASAGNRARALAKRGRLISRPVKDPGSRAAHAEYWRPGPKIISGGFDVVDVGPVTVGDRMARDLGLVD